MSIGLLSRGRRIVPSRGDHPAPGPEFGGGVRAAEYPALNRRGVGASPTIPTRIFPQVPSSRSSQKWMVSEPLGSAKKLIRFRGGTRRRSRLKSGGLRAWRCNSSRNHFDSRYCLAMLGNTGSLRASTGVHGRENTASRTTGGVRSEGERRLVPRRSAGPKARRRATSGGVWPPLPARGSSLRTIDTDPWRN